MKEKLLYCAEITWFYTLCVLGLVVAPFIFILAIIMYARYDYEKMKKEK